MIIAQLLFKLREPILYRDRNAGHGLVGHDYNLSRPPAPSSPWIWAIPMSSTCTRHSGLIVFVRGVNGAVGSLAWRLTTPEVKRVPHPSPFYTAVYFLAFQTQIGFRCATAAAFSIAAGVIES